MDATRNSALEEWMAEHEHSSASLARELNSALENLTGRPGKYDGRTVRDWKSGRVTWPNRLTREALKTVTGLDPTDLGFVPRGKPAAPSPLVIPEDDVNRRRFGVITAAAVAAPLVATRPTVGTSDVHRARAGLDRLTTIDQARGGHAALEQAALAGARATLDLQKGSATQRIRQRLFSVAAAYTSMAAWSCLDARQLSRAQELLNEALRLAGMAGDSTATMRVWNSIAMLAHHRTEYSEAVAAAQAAQATTITRRDPCFASLGHARAAVAHATLGDRQAARRSLGHAREALASAEQLPRPAWIAFYGPAELEALAAIVHAQLDAPADAEMASHRALAILPAQYRRNRAMITARLALAQACQGEIEQACDTTGDVFVLMARHPLPGRLRVILGDLHRHLFTIAPSATVAREWTDRYRSEWSTV
ncbi:XRE family transcriptional regulator [Streptomyces sp. NPDC002055]|uniref:XRE family transcriptional regulator n=1 Tax=Streptomyces sp. NPDC002055 TaxID=3154534 RepID=UPI003325890E